MPTKDQIATVVANIKDVIGRNYIEGNGDMCSCWFQPEGGGRVGMGLFKGSRLEHQSLSLTCRVGEKLNC